MDGAGVPSWELTPSFLFSPGTLPLYPLSTPCASSHRNHRSEALLFRKKDEKDGFALHRQLK